MDKISMKDYNTHTPLYYEVKADAGKPKLTLVPRQIIWDIAEIREYGNNKYPTGGPENWRQVDVARYRDAAFRHFLAYLDDPDSVDEESGLKHLKHLACNIAFLCEKENKEHPIIVHRDEETANVIIKDIISGRKK